MQGRLGLCARLPGPWAERWSPAPALLCPLVAVVTGHPVSENSPPRSWAVRGAGASSLGAWAGLRPGTGSVSLSRLEGVQRGAWSGRGGVHANRGQERVPELGWGWGLRGGRPRSRGTGLERRELGRCPPARPGRGLEAWEPRVLGAGDAGAGGGRPTPGQGRGPRKPARLGPPGLGCQVCGASGSVLVAPGVRRANPLSCGQTRPPRVRPAGPLSLTAAGRRSRRWP